MAFSELMESQSGPARLNKYFLKTSGTLVDFSTDLLEEPDNRPRNGNSSGGRMNSDSFVSRQLLDVEILYLLGLGPKTGYSLKKDLEEMFKLDISFGTIYPHLRSLQKSGLISAAPENDQSVGRESSSSRKVLYSPTLAGVISLRQFVANISRIGISMHFTLGKIGSEGVSSSKELENAHERISALHTLKAMVERRGFTVFRDLALRGFSGNEYQFEMLASKAIGKKKREKILFHLVDERSGAQFGLDGAFKLLAIGQDVGARIVLLAIPRVNQEVSRFLNLNQATVFEGENWQSNIAAFTLQIDRTK